MKLKLIRDTHNPKQTLGKLFIDGKFETYTCEDPEREVAGQPVSAWKIPGQTAIPRGTYRVQITLSPKYKRLMPVLVNVPGFDGIRIHSGNTADDSEGCILLGDIRFATYIGASRIAVARVQDKIDSAIQFGEIVTITIESK